MNMRRSNNQDGFSLLEVLIAMGITLTILTLATTLLAASFRVRSREDRKSDAVADVQRALNIMTREIANAGLKLPSGLAAVSSNGVVANDSDNESLRIVSNLNGLADPANGYSEDSDVEDSDEDLKFLMYVDAERGQRYIVRYERNGTNQTTVLANRVDSLIFRYYDEKVTYDTTIRIVDGNQICDITNVKNAAGDNKIEVSPGAAKFVVIAVGVTLPAVGTPNTDGYQPPSQVQLTSDVVLRNFIDY
jgi:prepilin-type N-terminal cleavage/methylation domain-containing protein